ncbi:hypothetical protein AAG906_001308 [Vitis piasezkii]
MEVPNREFTVKLDSFDIPFVVFYFLHQPELEKEQELEGLLKDLANCKVQLEAKDSPTCKPKVNTPLLKLDHYRKAADELSSLLKSSEVERDKYINECIESRTRIDELETKMKEMADQLLETAKVREQLSHVLSELKSAQEELLRVETELADARASEFKAMTQAELMQTAVNMERGKTAELLKHVSELNEAIVHSKLDAIEAEKENSAVLSEKEVELQLETETATLAQTQEQLEELRKQTEIVQFLENELLAKSVFIETLQFELKEANELHSLSAKAASDAINNLNQLKSDFERQERENSE